MPVTHSMRRMQTVGAESGAVAVLQFDQDGVTSTRSSGCAVLSCLRGTRHDTGFPLTGKPHSLNTALFFRFEHDGDLMFRPELRRIRPDIYTVSN